jgi:hypothetical protein
MSAVSSQGGCIRFPLIALRIYNARRWRLQVFFGEGGGEEEEEEIHIRMAETYFQRYLAPRPV